MSNPKRRNYSPEFKDEAVQLVLAGPGTVTDVARELGLNPQTLRNWVNKLQEPEPDAEPPLKPPPPSFGAGLPDPARSREPLLGTPASRIGNHTIPCPRSDQHPNEMELPECLIRWTILGSNQ
ncbi:hypothetical protein GCM10029992_54230 [Glycomyces albus]